MSSPVSLPPNPIGLDLALSGIDRRTSSLTCPASLLARLSSPGCEVPVQRAWLPSLIFPGQVRQRSDLLRSLLFGSVAFWHREEGGEAAPTPPRPDLCFVHLSNVGGEGFRGLSFGQLG